MTISFHQLTLYIIANLLLPSHGQQNAFSASGGKELHQHNFPTPHHTLAGRQNVSRKRFTHLCLITSCGEHFTRELLGLSNRYKIYTYNSLWIEEVSKKFLLLDPVPLNNFLDSAAVPLSYNKCPQCVRS